MITIVLSGGLGNQMFQYAAGRALSLKLDTEMSVDLYALRKKSTAVRREYQLNIFNTTVRISQSQKVKFIVKTFLYFNRNSIGKKILRSLNVFKDEYSYDSGFERLNNDAILFGYFQNEKYFKTYEKQIRQDFSFNHILNDKNKQVLEEIRQSESVSIHIRRGDYTSSSSTLALLDIDYYRKAIRYINESVRNPSFYIFSDDIEWVRKNLNIDGFPCTYVDWNKESESYVDMQLMSCCKHNVMANSSFSWWGAWLNPYEGKIVIAPSVWYRDRKPRDYADGFIPREWIII